MLLNFVPEEAQEIVPVLRHGDPQQYQTTGGPGEPREAGPESSPALDRDTVPSPP